MKYLKLIGKKIFILCTSDAIKARGLESLGIVCGISGKIIAIKI